MAIYGEAKRMMDDASAKAFQILSSIPDSPDAGESADNKKGFDRYTALVANYRTLSSQVANGVSRGQLIRNELNRLSSERDQLARLSASFSADSRELDSAEAEIKAKKEKLSALQSRRASLGLFAGKQKKKSTAIHMFCKPRLIL